MSCSNMVRGLFIAGTDTEVGKTYVAAAIARQLARQGLRVGVYKPVASGCVVEAGELVSEDARLLWDAAGRPGTLEAVCPQRFAAPLAPPVAAAAEGRSVDANLLRSGLDYWLQRSDIVLVEGVGGWMSPISDDDYVADLACDLGYPAIVVAPNALGVINQTLQTLITAATFRDGIEVAGIVLNQVTAPAEQDPSAETNAAELAARCVPPLLTHLDWRAKSFADDVDWPNLARPSVICR